MSKNLPPNRLSYGYGYVIQENAMSYLVGRVLTLIEALGLPEKQEKSLKELLSQEIYKTTHVVDYGGVVYISPSMNDEIHRVYQEIWDSAKGKNPIPDSKFHITYEK